jgi:hypothetical protein
LGNDSALALSTGAATITGTLGVSNRLSLTGVGLAELFTSDGSGMYLTANTAGGMYLATEGAFFFRKSTAPFTEYARITSVGNVGIGTAAPTSSLDVVSAGTGVAEFEGPANATVSFKGVGFVEGLIRCGGEFTIGSTNNFPIAFLTNNSEKVRILAGGGITFNGDTAAANALDDYEEGTFTATLKGSTTDPTTPVTSTGTYTKIGPQVTVVITYNSVNTTGANGNVSIAGMPFTSAVTSTGAVNCFQFTFPSNTSLASYIGATSTTVEILISGNNANWAELTHSAGGSRFLWTTITYFV